MTLHTRGAHRYGDDQADIRAELLRYSTANAYPVQHYADAVCRCGSRHFQLSLDDTEGAAVRRCAGCQQEHPMGDSEEYLEEATLEACACPCGADKFEITAGVSLYADSAAVRWLYLGCRCRQCGLTAVYGDWKNEFESYGELLANI